MASFADILNKRADEVEAPKPVPVGTYLASIDPSPKIDGEKGTVMFTLSLISPQDDVDPEQLAEFGGVQGRKMFHTLWFLAKEDSGEEGQKRQDYRNKKFFVDTLGMDESASFGQMIPDAVGRQLLITVNHTPSQDGTQMYANIKSTAKAE